MAAEIGGDVADLGENDSDGRTGIVADLGEFDGGGRVIKRKNGQFGLKSKKLGKFGEICYIFGERENGRKGKLPVFNAVFFRKDTKP